MSYQSQAQLNDDAMFQARNRSVAQQQATTYINDARPNFVALAKSVLKAEAETSVAFARYAAAGPGIADKVDIGDGTVDQTQVTDADLLSLTQANWPTIATLYFAEDGSPI